MKRAPGFLAVVLGLVAMLTLGGALVLLFGGLQQPQPVAQHPYPVGTAVPTTVKVPTATPLPTPMAPACLLYTSPSPRDS